jgi:FkbM family methyltransferase
MQNQLFQHIMDAATESLNEWSSASTLADVFWCYRLLLQREPEFEDEAMYKRRLSLDLRTLVQTFIDSVEFTTFWAIGKEPLPDLVLLTEWDGLRFWFRLRDRAIGQNIAKGCYEPSVTELVKQIVKPGMNCLDAGANIGYFTVVLGRLVGAEGSIHSFEPFPENYELLMRNIKENSLQTIVSPWQLAASEQRGTGTLFFRADALNDNYGSMFISDHAQDGHLQSIRVRRADLDSVLPENVPIHFVKMDIEGAEVHALQGMRRTIERYHPTMIIELNEQALITGGDHTAEDLISLLTKFGYIIQEVGTASRFRLPAKREKYILKNLLCTCPK